jgi:SAM-dependent methyltransferase
MTFKNPFFALFEGHVIHAASKKLQEKYKQECQYCSIPINLLINRRTGTLQLSVPFDWMLLTLDRDSWCSWKVKQLASFTAGLLDESATYSDESNSVGIAFREFLSEHISLINMEVLDVGCGALKIPIYLEGIEVKNLFGIEPFDSKFAGSLLNCSAEFLPFMHDSFDLVVATSVIDHFMNWKLSLNEIARVLRPGGKLAIYQHLPTLNAMTPGSNINGKWYRLFEHGYLVEIDHEFDDPFHTKESLQIGWDIELARTLATMDFSLITSNDEKGFTIWEKS